jgi:hypothetical protein
MSLFAQQDIAYSRAYCWHEVKMPPILIVRMKIQQASFRAFMMKADGFPDLF